MEKKRTLFVLCTLSIFFSLGFSIAAAAAVNDPPSIKITGAPTNPDNGTTAVTNVSPNITTSTTVSPNTTTSTTVPPTTSTTHAPITTPSTPTPPTPTPSTSTKPSPSTSTVTPGPGPTPTPTPSPKPDRSFDLPSFVGGIILALGILAIGYVVYKFYRARTDPNYRTL